VVVIASAIALVVAVTLGVVFLAGAPWIYEGEPQLTRIDPINNALAESIPLPLAGGFVRSTGETISTKPSRKVSTACCPVHQNSSSWAPVIC